MNSLLKEAAFIVGVLVSSSVSAETLDLTSLNSTQLGMTQSQVKHILAEQGYRRAEVPRTIGADLSQDRKVNTINLLDEGVRVPVVEVIAMARENVTFSISSVPPGGEGSVVAILREERVSASADREAILDSMLQRSGSGEPTCDGSDLEVFERIGYRSNHNRSFSRGYLTDDSWGIMKSPNLMYHRWKYESEPSCLTQIRLSQDMLEDIIRDSHTVTLGRRKPSKALIFNIDKNNVVSMGLYDINNLAWSSWRIIRNREKQRFEKSQQGLGDSLSDF